MNPPPGQTALTIPLARTCERCGIERPRCDDLHLCGCVDQLNLCAACLRECACAAKETRNEHT